MVGFAVALQQTPRAVIDAPPSLVIEPPLVAVAEVIEETGDVVRTGNTALVEKVISEP